ncbi:MAG: alanyl-tRNA editing protein [Tagaea sp.]
MTEKLFWREPYATTNDARIVRVDGAWVQLDRSVFFAESGGQESDEGTIAGRPVREARLFDDGRLAYRLDTDHGLMVGTAVAVEIDETRRRALMRLHFAAEIVLELAGAAFPGIVKIGAHIAPDKARIDFLWATTLAPALPALQAEANALVAADRPIATGFEPGSESAERRYWEIAGFARVPCGGTHLARTGEIGAISLKRRNPGKGKERIEIFVA